MLNAWLLPFVTTTAPVGLMLPPVPALAVIVLVLVAVAVILKLSIPIPWPLVEPPVPTGVYVHFK